MKAFVTGGSGFVGRNLIEALAARGDEVVALARSPEAAAKVAAAGARAVLAELDDVPALTAAMTACTVAFHCAAKVDEWGDPAEFERVNVRGTESVIAAARAARIERLVHVSTEAVLVGSDGSPIHHANETWPLPRRPLDRYPRTKLLAERHVIAANSSGSPAGDALTAALTTVVVRPRWIWGRGDTAVLPKFVEAIRDGRFLWIADGRYPTSTCHVRNVVEGMLLAAEKGRGGEVYFLTDGDPVELRGFLTAMLHSQGVEPPDRFMPRWAAHTLAVVGEEVGRALRVLHLVDASTPPPLSRLTFRLFGEAVTVDDSKARRELGYRGAVTREQGLQEMTHIIPSFPT